MRPLSFLLRQLDVGLVRLHKPEVVTGTLLDRFVAGFQIPYLGLKARIARLKLGIALALRLHLLVKLSDARPPPFAEPQRVLQHTEQCDKNQGWPLHVEPIVIRS